MLIIARNSLLDEGLVEGMRGMTSMMDGDEGVDDTDYAPKKLS